MQGSRHFSFKKKNTWRSALLSLYFSMFQQSKYFKMVERIVFCTFQHIKKSSSVILHVRRLLAMCLQSNTGSGKDLFKLCQHSKTAVILLLLHLCTLYVRHRKKDPSSVAFPEVCHIFPPFIFKFIIQMEGLQSMPPYCTDCKAL